MMYELLSTSLFVLVSATLLAKLEIEIEGPNGWARKLPTWRKNFHFLFIKKELTGYHLYLLLFVLSLLHLPYLFVPIGELTWAIELKIFALWFLIFNVEDFLWFVLNPAYGLKRFNKASIHWHKYWLLGMPVEYLLFIPLGILLYMFAMNLGAA